MRLFICCAVLLLAVVAYAQSADAPQKNENEGRIFLSTSTTTIGTTTSCTTSTAALKTCSVGRRRRGLFYDDADNQGRARRGLFYNDDEDVTNKEESISTPVKRFVYQNNSIFNLNSGSATVSFYADPPLRKLFLA